MEAEYDDLVQCPWCQDPHGIIKKNLEGHYRILKKQKNPCVKDLRNCKYNAHHKIHKDALEKHYFECKDAEHFLQEDTMSPMGGINQGVSGKALPTAVQYSDCCAETPWDEPLASKDIVSCQEGQEESDAATDVDKFIRRLEKKLKEVASLERKGNLTKEEKEKIAKKGNWTKELEELKTSRDQMYS